MITIIRTLRKKNNYSQSELAELIEVSRPFFSEIEKGDKDLTISQAKKLAGFFGLSLDDFLNNRIPKETKLIIKKEMKVKKVEKKDMRISVPEKNIKKFKEVFLYVLGQVGAKPNIGESILCKLMYFIDFDFYEKYERQLMGAVYIKNHHGPTPVGFPKILKEMEKRGDISGITVNIIVINKKNIYP